MDGNLISEGLAGERNKLLGAARHRVLVAAHAASETVFNSFRASLLEEPFKVVHLLLGGGVAPAAGDIKGHARAEDAPEHLTQRLAGEPAQQVKDGEVHQGHR